MEGKISNDHVDIIWQAAQLKHCSKQVYDILSSLICHMEPGPVLHLHHLLKKLEPKDHTEQVFGLVYLISILVSVYFTSLVIVSIEPVPRICSIKIYLDKRFCKYGTFSNESSH